MVHVKELLKIFPLNGNTKEFNITMSTITKVRLISQHTAAGTAVQIYSVEPRGCTPLYGLYGDVPLDRVWFFTSLS